jgi:hypothetical protein
MSTHWIDIVNQKIVLENELVSDFGTIDSFRSGDERYERALKVVNNFIAENEDAREKHISMQPKKWIFIKVAYQDRFVDYFLQHFDWNASRKTLPQVKVKRPRGLRQSDEPLNNAFYKSLDRYNELTPRERLRFIEIKDMIHEEHYGCIRRFDKLPTSCAHSFITKNSLKRKFFIRRLNFKIGQIIQSRNLNNSAHYRCFVMIGNE